MQNSLDRLFDGLQDTLRNVVAPAIDDPYVASQLASAVEVLANLATRVEWRCDQARELVARARPLLSGATGELPLTHALLARAAPDAAATNAELVTARDEHLAALREVQRAGVGDEAELREFLAWHVETESARLRSGMFSGRPKKGEQS